MIDSVFVGIAGFTVSGDSAEQYASDASKLPTTAISCCIGRVEHMTRLRRWCRLMRSAASEPLGPSVSYFEWPNLADERPFNDVDYEDWHLPSLIHRSA
ncbi:hypothetical protein [Caballeronia grimmiae]|uniref:hypothetical protein n=1 Tax=Caballeronia grimmiae TaxID=1071679 RepID=UPI001FD364FB|nr:hypothetical protein [Caballeronia grimmiae]